jgi:hypothetical protein
MTESTLKAPQMLAEGPQTKTNDVYSFGMILYSMLVCEPFSGMAEMTAVS